MAEEGGSRHCQPKPQQDDPAANRPTDHKAIQMMILEIWGRPCESCF